MGCAAQIFQNVTPEAWSCITAKAAAEGFPITSPQGSHSAKGFTFDWSYDASAQTLSITCSSKPFYASCGAVNGKIHEIIDATGCLAQPQVAGAAPNSSGQ